MWNQIRTKVPCFGHLFRGKGVTHFEKIIQKNNKNKDKIITKEAITILSMYFVSLWFERIDMHDLHTVDVVDIIMKLNRFSVHFVCMNISSINNNVTTNKSMSSFQS